MTQKMIDEEAVAGLLCLWDGRDPDELVNGVMQWTTYSGRARELITVLRERWTDADAVLRATKIDWSLDEDRDGQVTKAPNWFAALCAAMGDPE